MSESGGTQKFTHLDESGNARMVDITAKKQTHRRAIARCRVVMNASTLAAIRNQSIAKGDVLAVARVAGIQGAKKTSELIPLCHPVMIGAASIDFSFSDNYLEVEATIETTGSTGVEMEALTACSVAALTIYDMCKAIDKEIVITETALWHKSGGRSGDFNRS